MKIKRKHIARGMIIILVLIILRCTIEIFRFTLKGYIPYDLLNAFLEPIMAVCLVIILCLFLLYYEKHMAIIIITLLTIVVLFIFKLKELQPLYENKPEIKQESVQ